MVSCGLTYLAWAAATERVKLDWVRWCARPCQRRNALYFACGVVQSNLLGVAAGVDDGKLEQALESMVGDAIVFLFHANQLCWSVKKAQLLELGIVGNRGRVNEREIFFLRTQRTSSSRPSGGDGFLCGS